MLLFITPILPLPDFYFNQKSLFRNPAFRQLADSPFAKRGNYCATKKPASNKRVFEKNRARAEGILH
jgi:hypothetical protein